MFGCEGLLQAKDKFESFLAGEQAHLTQEQHHYLALIVLIFSRRLQQPWDANTCGTEKLAYFWK